MQPSNTGKPYLGFSKQQVWPPDDSKLKATPLESAAADMQPEGQTSVKATVLQQKIQHVVAAPGIAEMSSQLNHTERSFPQYMIACVGAAAATS